MTKVIIDSFDTEEQAVAFVDWLKRKFDYTKCKLVTTEGLMIPVWDGVDTDNTNKHQITVNIVVDVYDEDEE
jgi:hypothetical protein